MAIRDLVPWNNRGREVGGRRDEESHPILSLHREMSRLFDDVFRGFDFSPLFSMESLEQHNLVAPNRNQRIREPSGGHG